MSVSIYLLAKKFIEEWRNTQLDKGISDCIFLNFEGQPIKNLDGIVSRQPAASVPRLHRGGAAYLPLACRT